MVMKRFFRRAALLVAAMAFVANASAQTEVGRFSLMPMVGFTVAGLTGNDANVTYFFGDDEMEAKADYKFGFTAGVEAGYQLTSRVGFTAALLYSLQGAARNAEMSNSEGLFSIEDKSKLNLSYLNVPILVNFYVAKGLALKAGIQPGFLLSAKSKADITGKGYAAEDSEHGSADMNKYCNKVDFSIPVGVSYEFSNGVVIDGRYNFGLTKCFKETIGQKPDSKNSVFQIAVGYKFVL